MPLSSSDGLGQGFTIGVGLPGADLDNFLSRENAGGQKAPVDAGGIDPQRPPGAVDPRAWGMAVNDKGRATPIIGPGDPLRRHGSLGGLADLIEHLDMGKNFSGLIIPGNI